MGSSSAKWKIAFYSLIALFLLSQALIFLPDYEKPRMVKFLIITQVLLLLSVLIFLVGRKLVRLPNLRKHLWIVLALALVARAIMLIGAGDKFYISDDVYRYLWDGEINANGINPYLYAPDSDSLCQFHDNSLYDNLNHNWMPTIYPPLAQNIFLVGYLIGGENPVIFKLFTALFELLTLIALIVLAREWNLAPANLLLYLFSPLILVEFYLSNHLDIIAMPFFVAALITLKRRQSTMTGVLLALATLVKFVGLFFVPLIFFFFKGKEKLKFTLALIITAVALYLPYYADGGTKVLGSLFDYLRDWQYNASIFFVLKYFFHVTAARYIVAGLFITWLIYLMVRNLPIERKLHDTYGGYLVLTPTLFPWYFVWIYPMMLRSLSPAFIYLSGALLLSYHVHIGFYANGTWSPMPWVGIMYYTPFYLLLIGVPLYHRIRRRRNV